MAFPGVSEVDLVLALQDAAAVGGAWNGFLAQLAAMTGARLSAMVLRVPGLTDPADIITAMAPGPSVPVDLSALSFTLTDRMRPERIYLTQELAELTDIAGDESLEDALARVGAVSVTAVRVAVPAMTMAIGIFGPQSFDAGDGAVLRRLIPYLHAAARGAARIWRERLHATLSTDLAFRNSLGWFLLNRDGVVLESQTASAEFLSTDRILSGIVGERLGLADRAAEMALTSILERLEDNVTPRTMALWVSHDPPLHLRIAPISGEWMFDPRQPKSLATLYGECRLGRDTIGLLTDLFGLLPSEARLAAALGDGDRLTEAADRLGLTIETARNYSKKIFAKTATRGQADLVRLILSNGLAELDYSNPVARS